MAKTRTSRAMLGILRFRRKNVDDAVVSRMGEIDNTVDLGFSLGYELVDRQNPIKRLAIGGEILHHAADSPVVKERGSADQLIFGIGAAYTLGFDQWWTRRRQV